MTHKAARAGSRLDELTFGTFNVRTAAVSGVNGIGHIDTLRDPVLQRVVTLLDSRRPKRTELSKSWLLDTASISAGSKEEKGNMGLDWR